MGGDEIELAAGRREREAGLVERGEPIQAVAGAGGRGQGDFPVVGVTHGHDVVDEGTCCSARGDVAAAGVGGAVGLVEGQDVFDVAHGADGGDVAVEVGERMDHGDVGEVRGPEGWIGGVVVVPG